MGMKLRDWGLCGEQGICLRGIGEQGGGYPAGGLRVVRGAEREGNEA